MIFWDWTLILLMPAVLLGIYAQVKVTSNFKRYSQVASSRGLTGSAGGAAGARRRRAVQGGHTRWAVAACPTTTIRDHASLSLSPDVGNSNSLAALGVAAHEAGHALQHAEGYAAFKLRSALVPVANIGSNLGIILFIVGAIFGASARDPLADEPRHHPVLGRRALHAGHAAGGVQRLQPGDQGAHQQEHPGGR